LAITRLASSKESIPVKFTSSVSRIHQIEGSIPFCRFASLKYSGKHTKIKTIPRIADYIQIFSFLRKIEDIQKKSLTSDEKEGNINFITDFI
jgi:hypothetical protein